MRIALDDDSVLSKHDAVTSALSTLRNPRLKLRVLRQAQARGEFPPKNAIALGLSSHAAARDWLCFHADDALRAQLLQVARTSLEDHADPRTRPAALELLAMLAPSELEPWISALSDVPQVGLRFAALRLGLRKAQGEARDRLALQALSDSAARVRRLGSAVVARHGGACDPAELLQIARSNPEAWPQILGVVQALPSIARLRLLLQWAAEVDSITAAMVQAISNANRQVQYGIYAPSPEQMAELSRFWNAVDRRHPHLQMTRTP